jgi:hypothetical protein
MLHVLFASLALVGQQPSQAIADPSLITSAQQTEPPRTGTLATYKAVKQKTGRDANSQVRLALWCEANGLNAERLQHLARAVLADPTNTLARGLLGLVADRGQWKRPDDLSAEIKNDAQRQKTLQEYLDRRARTPDKPDAQWKLALWCAENGLEGPSRAHLVAVVERDPNREAAWKRLGYQKHGNRWVTPAQLAAEKAAIEAQKHADKHWKPLLEKWRAQLSDKTRRHEAERNLATVSDPRALPSVWKVFVTREPALPDKALQLLGQIETPTSSRALALFAVFGDTPEIRRKATEALRLRDPREAGPLLVSLLRDRIKFKVKRAGGPGSPGEIVVENTDSYTSRRYSPPPSPFYNPVPGDIVTTDDNGLPMVLRPIGTKTFTTSMRQYEKTVSDQSMTNALSRVGIDAQEQITILREFNQVPTTPAQFKTQIAQANAEGRHFMYSSDGSLLVGTKSLEFALIPVGETAASVQQTAVMAEQKLELDVQSFDAQNIEIDQSNSRVSDILTQVAGQDLGIDNDSWRKWSTNLQGYAYVSADPAQEKPLYVEDVPITYAPQPVNSFGFIPLGSVRVQTHSCFAAGTPVRTMTGLTPIESLRTGDLLLAQNTHTGALGYQPILAVFHNPPNQTLRLHIGDDSIVATGIHRFWKAAKGWTMARDLQPGDNIRTLSGVAKVVAVTDEHVQPVFNLKIANGDDFFVGSQGLLVHDNSIIQPVAEPFDAPATQALADTSKPRTSASTSK